MASPHEPAVLVDAAYRLADDLLFPDAAEVDRTGEVPDSHWAALADAGLFGVAAPASVGGPGLDFTQAIEIIEVLTSGCLSTAFTWLQHHGVVIALANTTNDALREEILADAIAGRVQAGVAYAGAVPTPPRMRATRTADGWSLSGYAPFVSGWGYIDILQISARDVETDDVIAGRRDFQIVDQTAGIRSARTGFRRAQDQDGGGHGQRDVDRVGQHVRPRRPLCEHSGNTGADAESRGQAHRGPARPPHTHGRTPTRS